MKAKTVLFGMVCLTLLSGCVHQSKPGPKPVAKVQASPSVTSNVSSSVSVVSVPLDNQCVKNFAVLKTLSPVAFTTYRGQFDDINQVYAMYQRDAANLGRDPKELLSMELGTKLNQVCSRVKYAVYSEVQKKLVAVNNL